MPPSWKTNLAKHKGNPVLEATHLFSPAFGLRENVNVKEGPAFLDNPIDECATTVNLCGNILSWLRL